MLLFLRFSAVFFFRILSPLFPMGLSLFRRSFFTRIVLSCAACFFSFLWFTSAHAADRFWVGANVPSDVWEDTANWSAMSQGAGGSTVPGASDIAIFTLSGNTVRMRSDVTVAGIFLANTWTGSVLQGTGTMTVGRSGFRVGSGTFLGGNGFYTGSGSYTQTGGIVTVSHDRFTQSGSFSIVPGGGTGIPNPSFTSTGTFVLAGDTQNLDMHPIFAAITNLTMSGSSRAILRSTVNVTGTLQVGTGSVLTANGFKLGATGSTILNYATITEGTGAIVHTATFVIADSSYVEDATVELGQTIYLNLTDSDENIDGTGVDVITITITTPEGDSETVSLSETSNTSGIFRGYINTENGFPNTGNSRIDTKSATTLTVSSTDAQDALAVTDTATLALATTNPTTSEDTPASSSGGGGGGGRTTAAIQRGELPSKSKVGAKTEESAPVQQTEPKQQKPTVTMPTMMQQRTCQRVAKRFGNSSMLSRINQRLMKRFGFGC